MYAELDTLEKRVKYFREQKKLSQAQLANMVLVKVDFLPLLKQGEEVKKIIQM